MRSQKEPNDVRATSGNAPEVRGVRTRQFLGVLVLLTLIGANIFFFLPTDWALSQSKPASQQIAKRTGVAAEVYGRDKNPFAESSIEDDKVKPLPLDLVEEKGSSESEKPKPSIPESVKEGELTEGGDQDDIPTIRPVGSQAAAQSGDTTTLLNGADIEISTLVKAFSKLTKRNYIVDTNVKGKVTVHLTSAVSVEEAIHIFESILLLKGFTTVPIGKNIWKVVATKDAQKSTIPLVSGKSENPSDVLVTQLVRLKYTQASELQPVMNQLISKDGLLTAFQSTNSLIVIDSEANIKRVLELVNQLDVPALDQDITIIPVLHAEAKDVAEKLKQILGEDKDAKDSTARAALNPQGVRPASFTPPTPGQPTGASANIAVSSGDRRALPLKIIADERTNSIIVVADAMLTTKVRALCEQLDSKNDQSGGKFFVYHLQHADAEELADILNGLISGSGGGSGGKKEKKSTGSSISRNSSSSSRGSSRDRSTGGSSFGSRGSMALTSDGSGSPGQAGKVAFEGEISITADTSTNSLVINAAKSDYEKLKQVIEELDVRRQQVLVEATILQVSLDKTEGMGVEWSTGLGTDDWGAIGQNNFGGITNLIANPAALSDLTIAAASSGSIVLPGGIALPSQAVLITALSRNTNVNVLSSPTILATDNEEAEIVVGQNVPFVTSRGTNATNLNNTFNSIERQDVGITLRITPQISSGGFVVLKIFVEVSNVVSGTQNDTNGPTTSVNTTETTVEVKSNQMIVTGGLISDEVTDATRGIPYLKDVPILGSLFRRDDATRRRNNLLVFITPKVISDQFVAREATKHRSGKMSDEIEKLNSIPDRADLLQSENIDRVVEEIPVPSTQPSTIQDPKGAAGSPERQAQERTRQRLKHLLGDTSAGASEKAGNARDSEKLDELTFTVRPKLPGEKGGSNNDGLAKMAASPKNISSGRTYVVLRQIGGSGSPKPPFAYADENRTVGLIVTGSQQSAPGRFFSAGKRYLFRVGDEDLQFVCLGLFESPTEAGTIEPSLQSSELWYSLDASESLNLGRNQWRAF